MITPIQALHLQLIECISFNSFNGKRVADGLRSHRHLWISVIAGHSHQPHPAMRLFTEAHDDRWYADTL